MKRVANTPAAVGLLVLSCFAAVLAMLPGAPALAAPRPAAGMFLVADESLQDPNFYRSVVLLLHHDGYGSVGLIVNQHSALPPDHLLPDVTGLDRYRGSVFVGGPVDISHVSVLSGSDAVGEQVLEGVYLSNDAPSLERLVADGNLEETSLRIFIGYAGWDAGQLDREIATGSWRLVPASGTLVFEQDPSTLWQSLHRRNDLLRVRVDGGARFPPQRLHRALSGGPARPMATAAGAR